MPTTATIRVPGLKVAVPLHPDALPRDLVPMDGPAGEPVLDLVLEGGSLAVRARLNGKNYRKLLKQIAEHGSANVAVVLQGVLRPPASPGEPFVLEGAGFQVNIKTPARPPSILSSARGARLLPRPRQAGLGGRQAADGEGPRPGRA